MALPKEVHDIPGHVEIVERELYYRVASENYQGLGEIVEVGCFFGASTSSFAAGLQDNKHVHNKLSRIHVYDLFEMEESNIKSFVKPEFAHLVKVGDDFSPIFMEYVKPYAHMLKVNKGDARNIVWSGKPIEILFIDCAHTPEFFQSLIRIFYPYLIPGLSLVIDQDAFFHHAWWITVKNELLSKHLKVQEYAESTLVCKFLSPLDESFLKRNWADIQASEVCNLLESRAQRYFPKPRQFVEIQKAHLLIKTGNTDQGIEIIRRILSNPLTKAAEYRATETLKEFGLTLL